MFYAFKLIKHDGHLRTQGKCRNVENMSRRLVFSTFLHVGIQGLCFCSLSSGKYILYSIIFIVSTQPRQLNNLKRRITNKKRIRDVGCPRKTRDSEAAFTVVMDMLCASFFASPCGRRAWEAVLPLTLTLCLQSSRTKSYDWKLWAVDGRRLYTFVDPPPVWISSRVDHGARHGHKRHVFYHSVTVLSGIVNCHFSSHPQDYLIWQASSQNSSEDVEQAEHFNDRKEKARNFKTHLSR